MCGISPPRPRLPTALQTFLKIGCMCIGFQVFRDSMLSEPVECSEYPGHESAEFRSFNRDYRSQQPFV